jgi:hypothetical protein
MLQTLSQKCTGNDLNDRKSLLDVLVNTQSESFFCLKAAHDIKRPFILTTCFTFNEKNGELQTGKAQGW